VEALVFLAAAILAYRVGADPRRALPEGVRA